MPNYVWFCEHIEPSHTFSAFAVTVSFYTEQPNSLEHSLNSYKSVNFA